MKINELTEKVIGAAMEVHRALGPGWDAVTAAMKKAGALGWALAGAGPTILALSEDGPAPTKIAKAAEKAFRALGVEAEASVHAVSPRGARQVQGPP